MMVGITGCGEDGAGEGRGGEDGGELHVGWIKGVGLVFGEEGKCNEGNV